MGLPNIISNDRPLEIGTPPVRVDPGFGLRGVYSNTASSESRIRYWTTVSGHIRIDIHDALGRHRANALDLYVINTGEQEINVDNSELKSGVYVLRLEFEGGGASQPFVIVK